MRQRTSAAMEIRHLRLRADAPRYFEERFGVTGDAAPTVRALEMGALDGTGPQYFLIRNRAYYEERELDRWFMGRVVRGPFRSAKEAKAASVKKMIEAAAVA